MTSAETRSACRSTKRCECRRPGARASSSAASQPCTRSGAEYSATISGVRRPGSAQARRLLTSPSSLRSSGRRMRRPSLPHARFRSRVRKMQGTDRACCAAASQEVSPSLHAEGDSAVAWKTACGSDCVNWDPPGRATQHPQQRFWVGKSPTQCPRTRREDRAACGQRAQTRRRPAGA